MQVKYDARLRYELRCKSAISTFMIALVIVVDFATVIISLITLIVDPVILFRLVITNYAHKDSSKYSSFIIIEIIII